MGHLIIGTALAAVGVAFAIFVSVAGKLGADEVKAWAPRLTERLIDLAVASLPEDQRGRYAEEWRSHVSDVPGDLSKIFVAACFISAAKTMLRGQSLMARVAEIAVAGLVIILIAPWLGGTGLAIWLSNPNLPVLLRHRQVGRNNKVFNAVKFRTFDPRQSVLFYLEDHAQDPNVTRIGRFLRRFSFDRLPQWFNVLKGDISLEEIFFATFGSFRNRDPDAK